jgi:pimeloyl-ACP methyl ester carboxylesterase
MTEILSALPFHEVMIPTLFVRGELSNYIEDQDFEQIESYFPDSQIETVANSGHWVHAEAPEDFFEVVLGFCIR